MGIRGNRKKLKTKMIGDKKYMIKVLFVCHGNICRSTMAESVFTYMVMQRNLGHLFLIGSAGTHRDEIGSPVHHGTVKKLKEENIPVVPHRAVQLVASDFEKYDYIIAMDFANLRNIQRILGTDDKVHLLLDFAGEHREIADPWYTGNFDATYKDIVQGLEGFLNELGM